MFASQLLREDELWALRPNFESPFNRYPDQFISAPPRKSSSEEDEEEEEDVRIVVHHFCTRENVCVRMSVDACYSIQYP